MRPINSSDPVVVTFTLLPAQIHDAVIKSLNCADIFALVAVVFVVYCEVVSEI